MYSPLRVTMKALALLTLCFACQMLSPEARAATYNIPDGDVAGLVAAINAANSTTTPDTINLAPGGSYTLTSVSHYSDWSGPSGLPVIFQPLTVNGNGATVERSSAPGTPDFRIFYIAASNIDVAFNNLTIKGGRAVPGHPGYLGAGGGIRNESSRLLLVSCTVTGNSTSTDGGGGIYNTAGGRLTVLNSTISHNTGFGGRTGGGVLNFSFGGAATTIISNSTLYENRADGPPGFQGRGDSIADGFSAPGSIVIKNSILASPTRGMGVECSMNITPDSRGHNVYGDASCGTGGASDLVSANPLLGPLTDNGGPTPTHALLQGSPAIDNVPLADCTDVSGAAVATDQRGNPRPLGPKCDSGAYETSADLTPPVITPAVNGTLGDNGWYVSDVQVSWSVSDPDSSVSSTSGCDSATVTSDTAGVTFTCTAQSVGGTGTQSVTVKRDATAPTVTAAPDRAPNGAGWYNADVTVSPTYADETSGVASGANDATLGEGDNQYVSFSVTDNAGNTSEPYSAGPYRMDKTAPTLTPRRTPAANADGWNNTDVTVSVDTATDALSGVAEISAPVTLSGEGANQSATVTATDKAGNTEQVPVGGINIDKTAPTINSVAPDGGALLLNQALTFGGVSASDVLSGVKSSSPAAGTAVDTSSVGAKSFTMTATDKAGNTATRTVNYTVGFAVAVLFDQTRAAKSGSTIPIKLQLVDAGGLNVSSPGLLPHALSVLQTSNSASVVLDDAGQANPDFDFRFDPSLGGTGGYVFNLKTTGYGTGSYLLNFSVGGDPALHAVQFQVRQ